MLVVNNNDCNKAEAIFLEQNIEHLNMEIRYKILSSAINKFSTSATNNNQLDSLDYISTLLMLLVRSYSSTTNRSRRVKHSIETCVGQSVRYRKASVTSGNEDQVSQARFFPRPPKLETESQPVKA